VPVLDFWFEFSSTYSYLAAMRIEDLAKRAGVDVNWRPFLLGAIFKAQGWETSPFNIFSDKGKHMWRDLERLTKAQGLTFRRPEPFPQSGLLPARLALTRTVEPRKPAFCRAVYLAEFAEDRQIADASTMTDILRALDLDATAALEEAQTEAVKLKLREETAEAQKLAVFGAPTFITSDGELFWGNDRLEYALAWAASKERA